MKVNAYIDGFNLYHSILSLNNDSLKNVNLRKLCQYYLLKNDVLNDVYYFSALPYHLEGANQGKVARHKNYIKVLKEVNVKTILGKFKSKTQKCKNCLANYISYEEKQSDINIAITMLSDAYENKFDKAVLLTADTDFVSTIIKIKEKFPQKQILLLVPPNRNKIASELRKYANKHFQINAKILQTCLF